MAKQTLAEFGRIDILVSIPYYNPGTSFLEQSEEDWHRILNMTFFSFANATRSVLPAMIEQKGGSIIGIGSDAGRVGEPRMVMYGLQSRLYEFCQGLSKRSARITSASTSCRRAPRERRARKAWACLSRRRRKKLSGCTRCAAWACR